MIHTSHDQFSSLSLNKHAQFNANMGDNHIIAVSDGYLIKVRFGKKAKDKFTIAPHHIQF